MVAQVGLHLELDVVAVAVRAVLGGRALGAAELLGHVVVGQIGDVADHARHRQAAARHGVLRVVVAAVEIRIGNDGAARHLVETDVLRRQPRRAGDHHAIGDTVGQGDGPAQRLHAAQGSAHHRGEALDTEVIRHPGLRLHPVFHGQHRKSGTPGPAGFRIDAGRAGRAEAGAQVIDPDHEEDVGVDRLAGADHVVPPAHVGGIVGRLPGHVVRGIQRMADQDGIAALRVERAVGFHRELVGGQRLAAGQRQRLIESDEGGSDETDGTGISGFGSRDGCGNEPAGRITGQILGRSGHTDLFSWIYWKAPASGSGKSAPKI
ncbi:hypothetical protein D9M68_635020 [compost metagenome]